MNKSELNDKLENKTMRTYGNRLTHGDTIGGNLLKIYIVWQSMRQRCKLKYKKAFPAYAGKGIVVCDEWQDYITFKTWAIENGYKEGLTIERVNVNGNYEPSNCIWADWETQYNNTTFAKKYSYDGEMLTLRQISKKTCVAKKLLYYRIVIAGWSIDDSIKIPSRQFKSRQAIAMALVKLKEGKCDD